MSVLDRIGRELCNMRSMAARFGIEPRAFNQRRLGEAFADAVRACLTCPNETICVSWLDCAGVTIARVPEFCPNARRFERIKEGLGASEDNPRRGRSAPTH
jgi:hypothetical protein